jgi:hypothetical protein
MANACHDGMNWDDEMKWHELTWFDMICQEFTCMTLFHMNDIISHERHDFTWTNDFTWMTWFYMNYINDRIPLTLQWMPKAQYGHLLVFASSYTEQLYSATAVQLHAVLVTCPRTQLVTGYRYHTFRRSGLGSKPSNPELTFSFAWLTYAE